MKYEAIINFTIFTITVGNFKMQDKWMTNHR